MTKNYIFRAALFLAMIIVAPLLSYGNEDPRNNYKSVIDVVPAISTLPTVVEVPLPVDADYVLVQEITTGDYLSSIIGRRQVTSAATYQADLQTSTDGVRGSLSSLLDKNWDTQIDLLVEGQNREATTNINFNASFSEVVSELQIDYASNSALPSTVALFSLVNGREELVVKKSGYESMRMVFPERYGQSWRVVFTYEEPVRISGIKFGPEKTSSVVNSVRLLAQPEQKYTIYLYPENFVSVTLRDSGVMYGVEAIAPHYSSAVKNNPLFVESDRDKDTIPDVRDNCPADYNPDQLSSRGGIWGDVCDDFDNDSILNPKDNCPYLPNYNQRDTDSDGIGDECDEGESRLTEQYPWLPWLGIGVTLLVILMLFIFVARRPLPVPEGENENSNSTE